jgi:hypothetical protein
VTLQEANPVAGLDVAAARIVTVWPFGITAGASPQFFNANHTAIGFDNRSDDKGLEPEGVTIGTRRGATDAFVGLERSAASRSPS